jgi:NAD(P)-dependent dehydrogenase (short-subunit alcohol dehydrogenase family)
METVLVVESTRNIGVSAIQAALRAKLQVHAVVRNQSFAEKLRKYIGFQDGITTVEADIMSEEGVQNVVDQVKEGKLPAFQCVYTAAGLHSPFLVIISASCSYISLASNLGESEYTAKSLVEITKESFRRAMSLNFAPDFCTFDSSPRKFQSADGALAYRATIPYLLEQQNPNSAWAICTGAQGDLGFRPEPGMTEGARFAMATAAARANTETNVRFNEVYLPLRVDVDEVAAQSQTMSSTEFSQVYGELLARPDIRSSRISVWEPADAQILKVQSNIIAR